MKGEIVGKTGHVISKRVISPATVEKISQSGKTLWIKYNKIIPFNVLSKYETSEIISCGGKPALVFNNEYDNDYPEYLWLKYTYLRLLVLKKEYIEIKSEC